jgi:hypothetical protein
VKAAYELLGSRLHDLWRKCNSKRLRDLLIEHQFFYGNFLERNIAWLLTAQDTGENR